MDANRKKSILAAIDNELIIYPIVKDTFETFDKDKNVTIDKSELASCMLDVAVKLGASKPDKLAIEKEFQALDTDQSGTIDFKEFQRFIKKTLLAIVNKI